MPFRINSAEGHVRPPRSQGVGFVRSRVPAREYGSFGERLFMMSDMAFHELREVIYSQEWPAERTGLRG